MTTSEQGIELIKQHEGLRLKVYDDLQPKNPYPSEVKGTLTIGYGHTGPDVHLGMEITEQEAENLLKKDLKWAEDAVNDLFNDYGWRKCQNRFDALVSWVYNTGVGNLKERSLIKMIDKMDKAEDDVIERWNRYYTTSKGVTLAGLVKRRKQESDLFFNC